MQMSLEIDNSFFPHFKAIIDSFVKDSKVSVLATDSYDYAVHAPESAVISSAREVRQRVAEAEERVARGEYLTEEAYDEVMDAFFTEELGTER